MAPSLYAYSDDDEQVQSLLPRLLRPLGHRIEHLLAGPPAGMAFTRGDDDLAVELGVVQFLCRGFEAMNGIVEEVVVSIAHPDVDLTIQLGAHGGPFLFEDDAQVVLLPILNDRLIS